MNTHKENIKLSKSLQNSNFTYHFYYPKSIVKVAKWQLLYNITHMLIGEES